MEVFKVCDGGSEYVEFWFDYEIGEFVVYHSEFMGLDTMETKISIDQARWLIEFMGRIIKEVENEKV